LDGDETSKQMLYYSSIATGRSLGRDFTSYDQKRDTSDAS
jgi:hypothetical protein